MKSEAVVEKLQPFFIYVDEKSIANDKRPIKQQQNRKDCVYTIKLNIVKLYYKSSLHVETKLDKLAYRYWFLLGSHHAYLGKWVNQILLWILLLAWLPLVMFPGANFFVDYLGIFGIGLPALGVLWLVADLILIPFYVKRFNDLRFSKQSRFKKSEAVEIEEETPNFGYPITY